MERVGVLTVQAFNALPVDRAEELLSSCCAAPEWFRRLAAGRPYPDLAGLLVAADTALRALTWPQVATALDAHPRIGEQVAGPGRDRVWSRREQAGVQQVDDATRAALVEANREYERRFGHVFLIFANGRSGTEMLAAARARVAHDASTERDVVREELRAIARLRLERLFDEHL